MAISVLLMILGGYLFGQMLPTLGLGSIVAFALLFALVVWLWLQPWLPDRPPRPRRRVKHWTEDDL